MRGSRATEHILATLPVSADLEVGLEVSPDAGAEPIIGASATGMVGGSIEDATGDTENPITDFGQAVERFAAVCAAAANPPFLVTARAENFLYGWTDLDDTINRLQAFSKAGADVLYAPGGLSHLDDIRNLCQAVDKPVNAVEGREGDCLFYDGIWTNSGLMPWLRTVLKLNDIQ